MTEQEYKKRYEKLMDRIYPEFRPVVINQLAYKKNADLSFEEKLDIVNDLVYDIDDATNEFIRNHF